MTAAHPIDTDAWLQHAWRNRKQSLLLLAVMAGFLALLGWLLWGRYGLLVLVSVGVVAVLANSVFFSAVRGAEHPWDWNLYRPTKQVSVLGFSSRSVEKNETF